MPEEPGGSFVVRGGAEARVRRVCCTNCVTKSS